MRHLIAGLATAALAASVGEARAEGGGPIVTDTVVFTATRSPVERARTGSSVEVITGEELARDAETTLADYLGRLPGFSIAGRGSPGASSEVSLRGIGAEGILVRIDGIEIADPGELRTQADLGQILLGDIARIEVLKGSQSALYGGEAVGGVIDITTRRRREPGVEHLVAGEGGSHASFRGAYTFSGATERGDVSFTVQHFRTEGFSAAAAGTENDGYRNTTLSGAGSFDLTEDVTVGAAVRYFDRETEIDRVSRGLPVDATGRTAATEFFAARGFVELRALDDRFTGELSLQHLNSRRTFVEASDSVFDGSRTKAEFLGSFEASEMVGLVFGADWTTEGTETSTGVDVHTDTTGGFGQVILEPFESLTLTGAVRHDAHSVFGGFTTWRSTAAWQPVDGTTLRAAAGTGFRAPSNRELFSPPDPFFGPVGNPALGPETSLSWEAGIDQSLLDGDLDLSATYFELRTDDLIRFVFGTGYQQLTGESLRRGVEIGAEWRAAEWAAFGAAYTYIDARDPSGGRLEFVPRHELGLTVEISPLEDLTLSATGSFVSGVVDSGRALDPFFLLDAVVAYEVHDGVELYLRGENLLDQSYERVEGFGTSGAAAYLGFRAAL